MALVLVQISSRAVVQLPWNIIGEYNSSCTLGELYESIKTGSIPIDMWEFPSKFDRYLVSAAIGKSKTDTFDRISVNSRVSEAVAALGRCIRFELHKPDDNSNDNACTSTSQSGDPQADESST